MSSKPPLREQLYLCLPTWTDKQRQAFYEGYRKLYLAIAKALGLPIGEREDFVQQCFLIVLDHAGDFDINRPLWPWVATIGWNEGRNHGRRHSRNRTREGEMGVEPISYGTADPVTNAINAEDYRTILSIIDSLRLTRMNDRTIAMGRDALQSDDTQEVAERWGCSTDAVLLNKHRLKTAIQARLPKVIETELKS